MKNSPRAQNPKFYPTDNSFKIHEDKTNKTTKEIHKPTIIVKYLNTSVSVMDIKSI